MGLLRCSSGMEIVYWTVAILLILAGLVGSVVPLLPGTTLILVGVLVQKWLLPDTLSMAAAGWIAAFWLLSLVADIGCAMLGTRFFGGGKWGMAGASGGALAGMFFSLPAVVLGSVLGAVVAEKWLGKRTTDDSLRAGAGAAVGFFLGIFPKIGCALTMVALYATAVASLWPAAR